MTAIAGRTAKNRSECVRARGAPPKQEAEGAAANLKPMIPIQRAGAAGQELRMSTDVEVARNTLMAMGFEAEHVEAAVAALASVRGEKDEDGIGDEPLITAAELRARLKVSATSLWRMKGLPFVKVGGRKRYLWSEVRKHLANTGREGRVA